jgi:uncharacterized membrane protein YdjX (TVP38/TMEM64 family)
MPGVHSLATQLLDCRFPVMEQTSRAMDIRKWLKVLAPVLASIAGLVTLRLLGPDVVDQHRLAVWLKPLGAAAPWVFVFFLAIRPLTLLPGQLFTAVGGLVFGTRAATVYALVGHFLGSALTFWLARKLGKGPFKRFTGARYAYFKQAARRHGFSTGFILCLSPLFPTDFIVAAAAASGARFWPLALGVLLANLPGTVVTTMFGSSVGQGKTIASLLTGAGMVLSLILGAFLGRKLVREIQAPVAPAETRSTEPTAFSVV